MTPFLHAPRVDSSHPSHWIGNLPQLDCSEKLQHPFRQKVLRFVPVKGPLSMTVC